MNDVPPLTVTVLEALRLSGLSRTKIYELMSKGQIAFTNVGKRRLINYQSLKTLLLGEA